MAGEDHGDGAISSDAARPRRIVHVVESLAGGVLQSVAQLCWATSAAYELHVIHGQRDEMPADFRSRFPPGTRFSPWAAGREVSLTRDLAAFARLLRLLRQVAPDLVHAHSSKAGAHGRAAAALLGLPCVYSPRGYAFLRLDLPAVARHAFRGIEWVLGRLPAWTVACGKAEHDLARGVARRRVLIANMIDSRTLPVRVAGAPARFTVVMSGRAAPQKNFPFFLEVARRLEDAPMDFLWIGGADGPPETMPANLTVTGWIPRQEALTLTSRASVYLQTALWEGLPLAVLEAMAMGLPVVSLSSPGSEELVEDGRNGYLVHDVATCEARLRQLQRNPEDLLRMGRESTAIFRLCYASDVIGDAWLRFYADLLDRHGR